MSFNHHAKYSVAAAVLTTWALAWPQPASGDDIYNTFGPGLTHSSSSTVIFDSTIPELADYTYGVLAQGFRAPNDHYRLDQVSVPFLMDNPSANITPVKMSLFSGQDFFDQPPLGMVPNFLGTRLVNLTQRSILQGGTPSQPTVFSYTSATPFTLLPGEFYWLVAEVIREPASHAHNEWFHSGFTHPYLLNYFVGGYPFGDPYNFDDDKLFSVVEFDPDGLGLAMRIEATAVPEPSTVSLVAVSAVALLNYRWKLRSARKAQIQ